LNFNIAHRAVARRSGSDPEERSDEEKEVQSLRASF
jgi:hypothetical protein